MPHPYVVQYFHPWVRWDRQLCHIARRDRILRFPESITQPGMLYAHPIWGAEGEERMCACGSPSADTVRVFNLASGEILYELRSDGPKWRAELTVGALFHTSKYAPYLCQQRVQCAAIRASVCSV